MKRLCLSSRGPAGWWVLYPIPVVLLGGNVSVHPSLVLLVGGVFPPLVLLGGQVCPPSLILLGEGGLSSPPQVLLGGGGWVGPLTPGPAG